MINYLSKKIMKILEQLQICIKIYSFTAVHAICDFYC
jgi:hypothetical protein